MKNLINEAKRLQELAGVVGENEMDNEYKELGNDELVDILTKIHGVYSNEEFSETEPAFIEAAKHIEAAINKIKSRSGN
jgi:hypothetical protein